MGVNLRLAVLIEVHCTELVFPMLTADLNTSRLSLMWPGRTGHAKRR